MPEIAADTDRDGVPYYRTARVARVVRGSAQPVVERDFVSAMWPREYKIGTLVRQQ